MLGRIGNDVLRAVAILGGLLVAGALLVSTADPRVAQFRFTVTDLGGTPLPPSIGLDARPGHTRIHVSSAETSEARGVFVISHAPGDVAVDGAGNAFVATAYEGVIAIDRGAATGPQRLFTIDLRPAVNPSAQAPAHIVARADGLIVVSSRVGTTLRVWTSSDGARTFVAGGAIPTPVAAAGPVIVGPFGSLFAGVVTPAGLVGVVASADGGKTWSARGVTTASGADATPPSIAVDDAATLYVAWTRTIAGEPRVVIAHTRDLGLTWSRPITAAPPGAFAPQLVAGSLGRVGVAYLHRGELVFRQTSEALLRTPFWSEHLVARGVVCPAPCERAPYELTLTIRSRALFAARADDRLIVAEQVSGSGLR